MKIKVPMRHFCPVSWEGNGITKWVAKVYIYANGYMEETTTCPACGSTVSVAMHDETVWRGSECWRRPGRGGEEIDGEIDWDEDEDHAN